MKTIHWIWASILGVALIGISFSVAKSRSQIDGKEKNIMPMTIKSPSFMHDGMILARHTCDGLNVSPPLTWVGVLVGAKSLVLIVDDPDAPDPAASKMVWVHWVLYNIPPDASGLPEGVTANDLPVGTLTGINDWHRADYGGPCPPVGMHRYFFRLYALDIMLPDLKHPNRAVLDKAMQGHVLARSELVGLYHRQ